MRQVTEEICKVKDDLYSLSERQNEETLKVQNRLSRLEGDREALKHEVIL